ncbi:hypothetical protein [Rufibacter quisquiliarum]|uniref:EF-hand domain-containing protein n=1 Tax=Rufibacter quisquiliarum TaxID=1549639 RepID=A0A839GU71_9BACT|nr:hypothetical protein [Rufibacter quisquiliarum]MBA9077948.1 hypothetical protein [Rufibacter quisquiliarum]
MEKIKAYNQKLLAILGTLAVLGFFLVFLAGCYLVVADIIRNRQYGRYQAESPSIQLQDSSSTAGAAIKARQHITMQAPTLLDTAAQIYLIPVSLASIDKKQDGNDFEILDYGLSSSGRGHKYFRFNGAYCNIILYHPLTGTSRVIFDKTVHLTHFRNFKISGKQYLLMKGSSRDTDQDGQLNSSDLQSFYLYAVANQTLREVSFPGLGLEDFTLLFNSHKIILPFGVDQYRNGSLRNEPSLHKEFSITTGQTKNLVNQRQMEQIQKLVN